MYSRNAAIRVARDRVQLRLRETDELQKRDPAVHRLDWCDGRVADDGQPRDGRVQLRVQGAAVAGDVRARLKVIAGLVRVARQLGQQVERPRAGLGIAFAHLHRHFIAPFAVLGTEGRHARVQLAHAVGDDVLIALACVIDGEAVEILVAAKGCAVVQLALKAHRLRLGVALGKGRLDRVAARGPVGVLFHPLCVFFSRHIVSAFRRFTPVPHARKNGSCDSSAAPRAASATARCTWRCGPRPDSRPAAGGCRGCQSCIARRVSRTRKSTT